MLRTVKIILTGKVCLPGKPSNRLREVFLKNLETKRAEIFALESETGGTGADLAKLEEDVIEPSK
jgi:hypothetical protein